MKRANWVKVLALTLAVSLLLLAGCSAKGIDVTVQIIGPEGESIFNQTVTVNTKEEPTAMDATTAAVAKGGVTIKETDGFVTEIADLPSTETDGWLLYVNAEVASVGAKELKISEGDTIEWRYINYNEVFGS